MYTDSSFYGTAVQTSVQRRWFQPQTAGEYGVFLVARLPAGNGRFGSSLTWHAVHFSTLWCERCKVETLRIVWLQTIYDNIIGYAIGHWLTMCSLLYFHHCSWFCLWYSNCQPPVLSFMGINLTAENSDSIWILEMWHVLRFGNVWNSIQSYAILDQIQQAFTFP